MKSTKQRQLIIEVLKNTTSHPRAEQVHAAISYEKGASLATVYRNLNMLADRGQIRRIVAPDAEHFDYDLKPHDHFYCESCKRVYDVKTAGAVTLTETGYEAYTCEVLFFGLCPKCKNNRYYQPA